MNKNYNIPHLPLTFDLETKEILLQLNKANKALAELKGLVQTIPNEAIIINALGLQEAKDSSEIESIITTHDELYIAELKDKHYIQSSSTKEVLLYREALTIGFNRVLSKKILSNSIIKEIQEILEGNSAGYRTQLGTVLKNLNGDIIYTPPQNIIVIEEKMNNLVNFINDDELSKVDPLIKLAIIHHQFESIHPFYDGNGRTGRILIILYLVLQNLLDIPILYLSSYIIENKREYYRLLQSIRDCNNKEQEWQAWTIFMLKGIENTAKESIALVKGISQLMQQYKNILRPKFGKVYRHELLNCLFFHPYTKIDFMMDHMQVKRLTATKYLDSIVNEGLLSKTKLGKSNYYINMPLVELFRKNRRSDNGIDNIESVHANPNL